MKSITIKGKEVTLDYIKIKGGQNLKEEYTTRIQS